MNKLLVGTYPIFHSLLLRILSSSYNNTEKKLFLQKYNANIVSEIHAYCKPTIPNDITQSGPDLGGK